jgi:glucosyl-dolichyl phosphate glucuronosyltransferase
LSSELPDAAASVVVATHSEERWDTLLRAVDSARSQAPAPLQIIVAVDNNPGLCRRLRDRRQEIEVVDHKGTRGASGARNAGANHARAPVIAFLDDDVRARDGWLRDLLLPFRDPRVVGTGGMTLPRWQGEPPRWFPGEFGWVVGASYTGLPTAVSPLRNVWSENMAVRRDSFAAVGGFRSGFGKLGRVSRPEDTDFCIRAGVHGQWIYVPTAVVDHEVPPDRATFAFFLRRCYSEGVGKMELRRHLGSGRDLGTEREYVSRIVPLAFLRAVYRREFARAGAIAGGAAAAAAGVVVSYLSEASAR